MFDLIKGRGRTVFASSDAVIYLYKSYRFLGLNPPSKYRIPYLIYSGIMTFLSVFALPILFYLGFYRDQKILSVMEILSFIAGSLNALAIPVKTMTVVFYMKRLRSIEGMLTKLDKYYTKPKDQTKIKRCAIMGNRFVFGFAVADMTYLSSTIVSAFLSGRVPYSLWIPNLDWRKSEWEYYIQIIFDGIIIGYALYHQVVNDTYPVIYIYIVRTHLQLLAKRVERLGYDEQKSDQQNYNELKECIVIHQEILRIVSIFEPVVSITIFAQFMITAAILGVDMINIVIFANLSTKIASSVYYFAVLMQTLPTCYQASYLLEDCDVLRLAIFHCNWSAQNKRFNNLLIYFLHRSQDLIPLFAMKLVPIDLTTNLAENR